MLAAWDDGWGGPLEVEEDPAAEIWFDYEVQHNSLPTTLMARIVPTVFRLRSVSNVLPQSRQRNNSGFEGQEQTPSRT